MTHFSVNIQLEGDTLLGETRFGGLSAFFKWRRVCLDSSLILLFLASPQTSPKLLICSIFYQELHSKHYHLTLFYQYFHMRTYYSLLTSFPLHESPISLHFLRLSRANFMDRVWWTWSETHSFYLFPFPRSLLSISPCHKFGIKNSKSWEDQIVQWLLALLFIWVKCHWIIV